jgi:2-hydroxychromene-2-carboxylate isomerase
VISQLAGESGLEVSSLWRDLETRSYGAELAEAFGQFWKLHCFGVPTFEYGGEIFWGNDRLEMLHRHVLSSRSR